MKVKPWPIIILALMNFLSPIGNIILSAHLEKISVFLYLKDFLRHGTIADYVMLFAPWVSAYAVFAVKEWSFAVFMSIVALQTGDTFYQWYRYPEVLSLPTALAVSAINVAFGYYFLLPEVRAVYSDKKLRWWEQKPRYVIDLKCRILTSSKSKFRANIVDLSEGGVLLRLLTRESLQTDEEIELRFSRKDRMVLIRGKVVYARGDGGYGVQFIHDALTLKFVQEIVAELKKTGKLARGNISLGDDFNHWAKTLVSRGEGWRPVLPASAQTSAPETSKEASAEATTSASPA
jgi:hypothetical protein